MVPRLMPARKTHSSPFSDSPQAKSARNSSPSGLSKPQLPADPLQLFHRSRQAFPLAPSPSGVESIVAWYRLPIRRVNNRDMMRLLGFYGRLLSRLFTQLAHAIPFLFPMQFRF